jgi:uridine kinase
MRLDRLAGEILDWAVHTPRGRVSVLGVDGPDCAGKSTLSGALRDAADAAGIALPVVHADDFTLPRELRTSLGDFLPESYLRHYFDWTSLLSRLAEITNGADGSLAVVEGMFLFSPRIAGALSHAVRLELQPGEILSRALERDVGRLGDRDWVLRHYREQCIPAQRIYTHLVDPQRSADWVVDMSGGHSGGEVVRRPAAQHTASPQG